MINLCKQLNLPDEQIQELLLNEKVQLSSFQKNKIIEEAEEILEKYTDTEVDIVQLKRLLCLIKVLKFDDIEKLKQYLDEFLNEFTE